MLSISFSNMDIFSDLIRRLQQPLTSEEERNIADAIKDNFEEVWATKGASIGSRWENNVDLVETGALRNQMTSGRNFRINKNQIIISATLPYSSFVDKKYPFMDLSAGTLNRIANVYTRGRVFQR
jgi:hypothetical protein